MIPEYLTLIRLKLRIYLVIDFEVCWSSEGFNKGVHSARLVHLVMLHLCILVVLFSTHWTTSVKSRLLERRCVYLLLMLLCRSNCETASTIMHLLVLNLRYKVVVGHKGLRELVERTVLGLRLMSEWILLKFLTLLNLIAITTISLEWRERMVLTT